MKTEKKAIWKITGEIVTVIHILEEQHEALFIMPDGFKDHTDIKNLIFIA